MTAVVNNGNGDGPIVFQRMRFGRRAKGLDIRHIEFKLTLHWQPFNLKGMSLTSIWDFFASNKGASILTKYRKPGREKFDHQLGTP